MTARRRAPLLAFLVALALALALAAPAGASADNAAVAVNTKDGTTLFDFAFQVRKTGGKVVDETNAAVAYSSCEACTTVAAAFQIVLVMGQGDQVTPTNLALAVNDQCTACATYALAYQFVLGGSGPMRFTPEGQQSLNDIRRRLKELERSDLPPDQVLSQLQGIRDDIVGVLSTQLQPAGRGKEDGMEEDGGSPPADDDSGAAPEEESGEDDDQSAPPTSTTPITPDDSTRDGDGTTTPPEDSTTTTPEAPDSGSAPSQSGTTTTP